MNLVTPKTGAKHEILLNKPTIEVGLLNIGLTYVTQQSVTKIIFVTHINLVTPKAGAKHEILFNKLTTVVGLLNI
jgi:hypothetical protein